MPNFVVVVASVHNEIDMCIEAENAKRAIIKCLTTNCAEIGDSDNVVSVEAEPCCYDQHESNGH